MLIAAATLLLSVCASVFTFVALTKIEAWMGGGRSGGGYAAAAESRNPSGGASADPRYGGGPSFSPDLAAEDPVRETNAETVADGTPTAEETFSVRPAAADPSGGAARTRTTTTTPSVPGTRVSKNGAPLTISNASADINLFALTFDGGSSANAAADILDTLASRGVKSTVFLTGAFIKRYPQTVTRIAAEGHELGNHTMNHPHLTTYAETRTQTTRPGVSRALLAEELTAPERLLFHNTDGLRFAPLWRAPFGEYNQEICEWALSIGYIHIGWRQGGSWRVNLDSNDWVADESSPAYKTPQEIFDKIVNIARKPGGLNGGIILMHLGTERKQRQQQAHTILGKLIDTLTEMGYKPVTVSTLLYYSGIDIDMIDF